MGDVMIRFALGFHELQWTLTNSYDGLDSCFHEDVGVVGPQKLRLKTSKNVEMRLKTCTSPSSTPQYRPRVQPWPPRYAPAQTARGLRGRPG